MDAFETIREDRVVAVVRAERVADPAGLAETLAGAGIRCVELTFTIPSVLDAIEAASGAAGAVVGAGTVTDAGQARAAIERGARFVVSPVCAPDLVTVCYELGVPVFLGAMTPTEVHRAVTAGATAVKLFPAALGGPSYVRELLGPFPDVALLPSGGVTAENAAAFLEAGAVAVYAGGSLVPPELVREGEHDAIGERARAFVAAIG